ncbi:MAG: T9SS type A sorting domain-containing protein [Crocinitomicaceae bacterium]
MKTQLILSLASFFLATSLIAQNLVPNPDFELRDADFCGIAGPIDLENSLVDWYSATSGTPDVHFTDIASTCWNFQPNSTYPGPIGLKGTQLPRSGSSMAGISLFSISGMNQREYIQVQLASPLVPTGKYLVEYYVSLADYTEFASNNMGFYLSTSAAMSGGDGVLPVSPQYVSSAVVGDIQGWVRIADTVTATEASEYLTIGNFSDDAATTLEANPSASFEPGMYGAYYFLDDVRVERVFTDTASIDQLELLNVSVFPNPVTNKLNIEFSEDATDVSIELIDMKGKMCMSIQDKFQERTIDLSDVGSGAYLLRIETPKGVYTERIVKE